MTDYGSLLKKAMKMWFEEYKDFPVKYLNPYQSKPQTGHFTAMIWAQTQQIGCGMTQMKGDWETTIIACDYEPGGNILGQEVYKIANSCSLCQHSECENSLCF